MNEYKRPRQVADDQAREFADFLAKTTARIHGRMDDAVRRIYGEDAAAGRVVPPSSRPAVTPRTLSDLPPHALHKLECAQSRVEGHGIRERFWNVRMLGQLIDQRKDDATFADKLECALAQARHAQTQLDKHFSETYSDLPLAHFCPEAERVASHHVDRMLRAHEELKGANSPQERIRVLERCRGLPSWVDAVLAAVRSVGDAIRGARIGLVGDVLEEAVDLYRARCDAKRVALTLENPTGERLEVFGNPQTLQDTFGEAIKNAIQHAFPDGHGVAKPAIRIEADHANDERTGVRVRIVDNGVGMGEDIRAKLGRRGVSTSGSGDGVAMLKTIIERDHLGSVEYDSTPGNGTTVTVTLPVKLDLSDGITGWTG